jgi:RNA polymerase primary sigma factor
MYMREMGTVELLTREGEIEIAKRIEGGLQAMMLAISASPPPSPRSWPYADKIGAGEMQISEVVDGFVSEDEADDYVAEEDVDEFDEDDDDDGQGGSKALTKKLEELKNPPRWASSTCCERTSTRCAGPSRRKATSRPPTTRPSRPSVPS